MFRNVVRLQWTWTSPPHQRFDRCCGHSPGWLGGPSSTTTGFLVVASPLRLGGHGQDSTTTTGGSSGEEEVPRQGTDCAARFKEKYAARRHFCPPCPLHVPLRGPQGRHGQLRGRGHRVNQGVGIFYLCRSQNARQRTARHSRRFELFCMSVGRQLDGRRRRRASERTPIHTTLVHWFHVCCVCFFVAHHLLCR